MSLHRHARSTCPLLNQTPLCSVDSWAWREERSTRAKANAFAKGEEAVLHLAAKRPIDPMRPAQKATRGSDKHLFWFVFLPVAVTEAAGPQGCYGSYQLSSEMSVYYYRFDAVPKRT